MASQRGSWLHGYSVFVAVCAFILVVTGAMVTSETRQVPGLGLERSAFERSGFEPVHAIVALLVAVLAIGLAIALSSSATRAELHYLGWTALAAVVLEGMLGTKTALSLFPRMASIFHALLAQLFFSNIVAITVVTSESWKRHPDRVEDTWRPSLRSLAMVTLALVFLQVSLGAAYRHQVLGVLPHILNAMILTLLILVVGVFVTREFPDHPSLRPAAIAVMVITCVQVLLGFTTYIILLVAAKQKLPLATSSVAHVATGALTLAASLVLAIQVRRNVGGATRPPG